jgi:hypothetical protein
MCAMLLASRGIKHRDRVAGPIDEQLLARHMRLPHGRRDSPPPLPVEIAEPAVAVALSVLRPILLPEQHQRNAAALEVLVHLRTVGQLPRRTVVEASRRKQSPLQLSIVHPIRKRPPQTDYPTAAQVLADRRLADTDRVCNQPLAHTQRVLQPKHLANLPHQYFCPWHPIRPRSC